MLAADNYIATGVFTDQGQRKILDTCVRKHQRSLYGFLLTAIKDPVMVDDIMQDIFEAACRYQLHTYFNDEPHCARFFFRSARYQILKVYDRILPRQRMITYLSAYPFWFQFEDTYDKENARLQELKSAFLHKAIRQLTAIEQLFLLTFINNDSNAAETANRCNLSTDATREKWHKVLLKLQHSKVMPNELKDTITALKSRRRKPPHVVEGITLIDALDLALKNASRSAEKNSYKQALRYRIGLLIVMASNVGIAGKQLNAVGIEECTSLITHIVQNMVPGQSQMILSAGNKAFSFLLEKGYVKENFYRQALDTVLNKNLVHNSPKAKKERLLKLIQWINEGCTREEIKIKAQEFNLSRARLNVAIQSACAALGKTTKDISLVK